MVSAMKSQNSRQTGEVQASEIQPSWNTPRYWKRKLQNPLEQRSVSSLLSYLILLSGLATITVTGGMVVTSYSSLPFEEGWMQISAQASGTNPLALHWL